jgi:hypothetical protein
MNADPRAPARTREADTAALRLRLMVLRADALAQLVAADHLDGGLLANWRAPDNGNADVEE